MVAGHVPNGRHLSATCGRYCSSEHTPRLGFWSHQFPASCVTWTTPQRRCPNPIHKEHTCRVGFGSHQFPASWSHGPLRSETAQASTHIRRIRSALGQRDVLHISTGCQHKPQDRPSTCTLFFLSGLRYMHDGPRTSIIESTLRGTSDGNFALLREPIGRHTPSLIEPDRPSGDSLDYSHRVLGGHVGATSLWSFFRRNRRCSRNVWALSFGNLFQCTRYPMVFSIYADLSCASDNLCSVSA